MKIQGIHIRHPGAHERASGKPSSVYVTVDRGLRSGKLDEAPLSETELIGLIAEGSRILAILRDVRLRP